MMKVPSSKLYRPDIDGLRSIAVLSVILYHFEFALFSGGFVGVDVFFVISGYLITRLIVTEVETTGAFRFSRFYLRRIRRLFPAMFVVLIASLLVAFLLFSPEHLARFAGAAWAATFSLSNFYFWSEAGYFDSAATVKPLLHTWSLSVEEQFYIIWPVTLFVLVAYLRTFIVPALVVLGVVSLGLNYAFYDGVVTLIPLPDALDRAIEDGPSTVFFLMPFRIFEFAIGAGVVWTQRLKAGPMLWRQVQFALGLILILVPIFVYTHHTPFPLHYALVPCLGTALIINAGNPFGLGRVLDNPVAVWIGQTSYSSYLLHWPLFVFYTYWKFEPLVLSEKLAMVLVVLALAAVMYRWIEQPFRRLDSGLYARFAGWKVASASGVVVAAALAVSAFIFADNGWNWRVPQAKVPEALQIRYKDGPVSAELAPPAGSTGKISQQGAPLTSETRRGLIIGDSHAGHLRWMAERIGQDHDITFVRWSQPGCPPVFGTYKIYTNPRFASRQEPCKQTIETWESYATDPEKDFDFVVLAARWAWMFEGPSYGPYEIRQDYLIDRSAAEEERTQEASRAAFAAKMRVTVRRLQEAGVTPILVSQAPHHGKVLEGCQVPTYLVPSDRAAARCLGIEQSFVRDRMRWIDDEIRAIGAETGADILIQTDIFCAPGEPHCRSIMDGLLLSNDGSHLNRFGSLYLAQSWAGQAGFPFAAAQ